MNIVYEIDGIRLINCTPHEIIFRDNAGNDIRVEKSGYTLPARAVETSAIQYSNGVTLVATMFCPTEQGQQEIEMLESLYPNADIFVGSIISAQAYPGQVCALVPTPDTVRAAPADKRYLANKFTIYE